MGFFLILLKGLRPLCNVTRSYVLVAVGVLYLPLHFIIIIVVIIVLLILRLLLISFLLFQLLLEFLSRAVYCSYEVSWPFGFVSFNFFIYLNLIHATTIWCWQTTSILSFGIIWLWWYEGKGHRPGRWCHLSNIMPDSISGDGWEVGKSLRFFFFFLLRGFGIMLVNNCRENS